MFFKLVVNEQKSLSVLVLRRQILRSHNCNIIIVFDNKLMCKVVSAACVARLEAQINWIGESRNVAKPLHYMLGERS